MDDAEIVDLDWLLRTLIIATLNKKREAKEVLNCRKM